MPKMSAAQIIALAAAQGTTIARLIAEREHATGEANRYRLAYDGMRSQRQEPANGAELQAARDALARAIKERDDARAAAQQLVDAQTTTLARATTAEATITELRRDIAGLQRTVDKLRAPAAQPLPAPGFGPSRSLRVTFASFPGWEIIARLRTFGTWDKRDMAWHLRDTIEAAEYLQSLTINGMAVEIR